MAIHYMDGSEPHDAHYRGILGKVIAYRSDDGTFAWLPPHGGCIMASADLLDPPPPIPAAARKPQLGEVWMHKDGEALFLFSPDANIAGAWYVMRPDATHSWCERYELTRPATPDEAEPFRQIFDGLKRSLGGA